MGGRAVCEQVLHHVVCVLVLGQRPGCPGDFIQDRFLRPQVSAAAASCICKPLQLQQQQQQLEEQQQQMQQLEE